MVTGHGQHIADPTAFQLGAQRAVVPIDLIATPKITIYGWSIGRR